MMNETTFLEMIYGSIDVGMIIKKPKKDSVILAITEGGHIYYQIGANNKKAVTKDELSQTHQALTAGVLSRKQLKNIIGTAKPCNATTIKWLLIHSGLAGRPMVTL